MTSQLDATESDRPRCLDGIPRVADIIDALERRYPAHLAESWDRSGLIVGDPEATVTSVLCSVDITDAIIDEACAVGADLIVTHHPLLLRGVTAIRRDQPKGRMVMRLIEAGIALYAAHTNADAAVGGVSDCLASAIGLRDIRPLSAVMSTHAAIPVPLAMGEGLGRVGVLPSPSTGRDVAGHLADVLPGTTTGVRFGGDPDRIIRTVAVLAGAGDSMLDTVRRAGVDLYVTSDLRHHPASEFLDWADGPGLIDVGHWAAEWLWLPRLQTDLSEDFPLLTTQVSTQCTDPWALRVAAPALVDRF